jgi:hypothetical protein
MRISIFYRYDSETSQKGMFLYVSKAELAREDRNYLVLVS